MPSDAEPLTNFQRAGGIGSRMRNFRVASRELFNNFFYEAARRHGYSESWNIVDDFKQVERVLFESMVLRPEGIDGEYGNENSAVMVTPLKELLDIPALINREIKTGYWDYPMNNIPVDSKMVFICFFDWSENAVRDNEFVRVVIESCTSSELVGKHALISAKYVDFSKRV